MPVDEANLSGKVKREPTALAPGSVLECKVCLFRDDDGGYTVQAARLPGAISEGETAEEALDNIRDALASLLRSYIEAGEPIPWTPVEFDRAPDLERWVPVNV
ncbi:MAG TPA: type II toxin-antitoxin system HicB family antitoxin [Planctomycetaceae bacterium]|nr:type II toxin-antitoxin system HicB family antitoxin [Planctomycetaceae bacterium]